MHRNIKRALIVLTVLALILTLVPGTASAKTTFDNTFRSDYYVFEGDSFSLNMSGQLDSTGNYMWTYGEKNITIGPRDVNSPKSLDGIDGTVSIKKISSFFVVKYETTFTINNTTENLDGMRISIGTATKSMASTTLHVYNDTISVEPLYQEVFDQEQAVFTADASVPPTGANVTQTIQWFKVGSDDPLSNSNKYNITTRDSSSTLVVSNASETDEGEYYAMLKTSMKSASDWNYKCGLTIAPKIHSTATSNNAELKLLAPSIEVEPVYSEVWINEEVILNATPSGVPQGATATYQWFSGEPESGTEITGENDLTFIPDTSTNGQMTYYVEMTVQIGSQSKSFDSNLATVLVKATDMTVEVDPVDSIIWLEEEATKMRDASSATVLTATPIGVPQDANITYQWYENVSGVGVLLEDETNETFYPDVSQPGVRRYYVIMTAELDGHTFDPEKSNEAVVTVLKLGISVEPIESTVWPNALVTLVATPSGAPDNSIVTYQWYDENGAIEGETGLTYIPSTAAIGTSTYYIVMNVDVNESVGTATSNVATVTVQDLDIRVDVTPDSQTVYIGQDATLLATPSGVPTGADVTYRWYNETGLIGDESGTTYVPDTSAVGIETYYAELIVSVNGYEKNNTSNDAIVEVKDLADEISVEVTPETQTVYIGEEAAIKAVPTYPSGATPSYQWYDGDGNQIEGATDPTYIADTSTAGTANYYVVMTVMMGQTSAQDESGLAEVIVQDLADEISVDVTPETQTVYIGEEAAIKAVPTYPSGATPSYQWYDGDGNQIEGATDPTYIADTSTAGTANYYVVMTVMMGQTSAQDESGLAEVIVQDLADEISVDVTPETQTVYIGEEAAIKAVPTYPSGATPSYQWYDGDGNQIEGATDPTYIADTSTAGTANYYVVMTVMMGQTSAQDESGLAEVIVQDLADEISVEVTPETQTVYIGEEAAIKAVPTYPSGATPSYQWYDGDGNEIEGATDPTYVADTSTAGTANYYVVMTVMMGQTSAQDESGLAEVIVREQGLDPFVNITPETQTVMLGNPAEELKAATQNIPTDATVTFQWFQGMPDTGTPLVGETTQSYMPDVSAIGIETYYVKMTVELDDQSFSKNSNIATVTVEELGSKELDVRVEPEFSSVNPGDEVELVAEPIGVPKGAIPTFQWYEYDLETKEGVLIDGETAINYYPDTSKNGLFIFYVEMTVDDETVTSNNAIVQVCDWRKPSVAVIPMEQTVNIGDSATLTAKPSAPGATTKTFQWYDNSTGTGVLIQGATSETYDPDTSVPGEYVYYVEMTTSFTIFTNPSKSNMATVIVEGEPINTTPSISVTPEITKAGIGDSVTLEAIPKDIPTDADPSFQWYSRDSSSSESTLIEGATSLFYDHVSKESGLYLYFIEMTIDGMTYKSNIAVVSVCGINDMSVVVTPPEQTVNISENAMLKAIPFGLEGVSKTYQWYKGTPENGILIPDATGITYDPDTSVVGTESYYVKMQAEVLGFTGENTSNIAIVTVESLTGEEIRVTIEPEESFVDQDDIVTLTATPQSVPDEIVPTYQWYSGHLDNGTLINGANGITYNPDTSITGVYYYYVVMTVDGEEFESNEAMVVVYCSTGLCVEAHPYSQEVFVGEEAEVEAVPNGLPEGVVPNYQWYSGMPEDGTPIEGATGLIYNPDTSVIGDYVFYVVMTVGDDNYPSNEVYVFVVEEDMMTPVVKVTPPIQTVNISDDATLTASPLRIGDATPTYQWYDGITDTPIDGATDATYAPDTSEKGKAYYYVVMTVDDENYQSNTVIVKVCGESGGGGSVTIGPKIQTLNSKNLDALKKLKVEASPGVEMDKATFQWFNVTSGSGIEISGATEREYRPTDINEVGEYAYYVVVTDKNGTPYESNVATIVVTEGLTASVSSETEEVENSVTMRLTVDGGTTPYTIEKWQIDKGDGKDFKDAKNKDGTPSTDGMSFKIESVSRDMDGWQFRATVRDSTNNKIDSTPGTLTVVEFAILENPSDQIAEEGETAVFSVQATGKQLTYQWQVSKDGSQTFENITTADGTNDNDTFETVPATPEMNGYEYRVLVFHLYSEEPITSESAGLTIQGPVMPNNVNAFGNSNTADTPRAAGSGNNAGNKAVVVPNTNGAGSVDSTIDERLEQKGNGFDNIVKDKNGSGSSFLIPGLFALLAVFVIGSLGLVMLRRRK